jgi:hypothetical protein
LLAWEAQIFFVCLLGVFRENIQVFILSIQI